MAPSASATSMDNDAGRNALRMFMETTGLRGRYGLRLPPQDEYGCTSARGEVDIARLLTLHKTSRLNGRSTCDELKTAIEHLARGKSPSLYWIRQAGMKAGAKPPRFRKPNRLARPAEWYE